MRALLCHGETDGYARLFDWVAHSVERRAQVNIPCLIRVQEHNADSLSACQPPCVYIRTIKNDHVTHVKDRVSPCQSSVHYGNTKRPSMHFADRRIHVLLCSECN